MLFSRNTQSRVATCAEFKQGHTLCEGCGAIISLDGIEPLTLVRCSICNDIVFVPLETEDWWVTRPLGAGGYGSVYLGESLKYPGVQAAIKVLRGDGEEVQQETIDDFMHEAEVAATFPSSPYLADIFAYGHDDPYTFIVMKFINGIGLHAYVEDHDGIISPEECLYYALDLSYALAAIHDVGFLYRDMKPENVLITPDGHAVLIDYGTCISLDDAWNMREGPIIGTPVCVPPERVLREGEDIRSDIYLLGMVLYFTLSREHFVTAEDPRTALRGHTKHLRIRTQSKLQGIDEGVADVVDHMIRRDREERMSSYEEVRHSLCSLLIDMQSTATDNPRLLQQRYNFNRTYKIEE